MPDTHDDGPSTRKPLCGSHARLLAILDAYLELARELPEHLRKEKPGSLAEALIVAVKQADRLSNARHGKEQPTQSGKPLIDRSSLERPERPVAPGRKSRS